MALPPYRVASAGDYDAFVVKLISNDGGVGSPGPDCNKKPNHPKC